MSGGVTIHGTAVVVRESGIVLRGPSGAGKSMLALLLIAAARQRGWFARLVGDDRLLLRACPGGLVAAPHPLLAGLVERRTQPILRVAHEARCRVVLVVDLAAPGEDLPRLPEKDESTVSLAGWPGLSHLRLGGGDVLGCATILDKLAAR